MRARAALPFILVLDTEFITQAIYVIAILEWRLTLFDYAHMYGMTMKSLIGVVEGLLVMQHSPVAAGWMVSNNGLFVDFNCIFDQFCN